MDDFITVHATGISIAATTTSGTTSRVAIPNTAGGYPPRFCRVAATGPVYVRFGNSAVTCATTDALLPGYTSEVFHTQGQTHVTAITGTGSATVSIVPLEDAS
jgi:hypothetical protein